MRSPILVASALIAGAFLSACSGPAGPARKAADRPILLTNTPAPGSEVVSDVEAGRPARTRTAGPRKTRDALLAEVLAPSGREPAVVSTTAPVRSLSMTMAPAAVPQPEPLDPASIGAAPLTGTGWHGRGGSGVPGIQAEGGSRGPVIILRGGRGGPDDDCDLRNTLHPRGGPIAVNRSAPAFGGYGRSSHGGIH